MVQKFDLYRAERNAGMPMELIIEKMYKEEAEISRSPSNSRIDKRQR